MRKGLLVGCLLFIALMGFFVYDYNRFNDGKLHIVFCDVGQGDAVFIRTPGAKNILIDGGPDKSIIYCLNSHMPFWDRTIHKMILSHPHDDHFFGMHYVLDRYDVLTFDTEDLSHSTDSYKDLIKKISYEKSVNKKISQGDFLETKDELRIDVKSPSKEILDIVSPNRLIAERGEQASLIQHLQYKEFDLYFASDNDAEIINETFKTKSDPIEVLQVPHHGSRFGLTPDLVRKINPKAAIISVGKNNYGHPSKEILKMFSDLSIKLFRTDEIGDVEIVTDGKSWEVK